MNVGNVPRTLFLGALRLETHRVEQSEVLADGQSPSQNIGRIAAAVV